MNIRSTRSALLICRGLPASGKSTFALEWVAQDRPTRSRVNRDLMRYMVTTDPGGALLDRPGEEALTTGQHALIRALLAAGRDVVVDDLNLRSRYVLALMRAAQEADARFEVVDFPVSVEVAVARDRARGEAGGRHVGAALIRTLAERFTDAGTPKPVRF